MSTSWPVTTVPLSGRSSCIVIEGPPTLRFSSATSSAVPAGRRLLLRRSDGKRLHRLPATVRLVPPGTSLPPEVRRPGARGPALEVRRLGGRALALPPLPPEVRHLPLVEAPTGRPPTGDPPRPVPGIRGGGTPEPDHPKGGGTVPLEAGGAVAPEWGCSGPGKPWPQGVPKAVRSRRTGCPWNSWRIRIWGASSLR